MNASFSLPPHSESTSMLPAERAAGFELAVAANVAATALSTKASRTSQERRFNLILLVPGGFDLGRHFSEPLGRSYPFQPVGTRLSSVSGSNMCSLSFGIVNSTLSPTLTFRSLDTSA